MLVEEVELMDVSPMYARIQYIDGCESTVVLKHLAPCPHAEVGNRVTENRSSDSDLTRSADGTPSQTLKDSLP